MKNKTFNTVQSIISKTFKIDKDKIKLETNFLNDLGLDSLDAIELTMSIENKLKIEIPDNIIHNFRTVKDVVNYIDKVK